MCFGDPAGDSGKHKIVSNGSYDLLVFHSGTKKTVIPKKKVFAARNLKDCLPSLPLKTGEAKKKYKFFYRDNFVLP
jgi:hypothetical protein